MIDGGESGVNRDQISKSKKERSWIPNNFKASICSFSNGGDSDSDNRCQGQSVRLPQNKDPCEVYKLMTSCWKLPPPNLVVSVVGGEGKRKVKPWVRKVIRQRLVKASQSTGAWIITTGLCDGIGKCVGKAIRDHATAASSETMNKVVALGIAPWGYVYNPPKLINPEGSFPAEYYELSSNSRSLDNNYQAFLLVDDGSVDQTGGETGFRAKLEHYISHQPTEFYGGGSIDIPVLCLLVSGEASMLERVEQSLKNSIPWLVLAGSGGLADFLSDALENLSLAPVVQSSGEWDSEAGPKVELKERMAERVKKHFPSEADTDKLVEQALYIYNNTDLITIYHGEKEGPNGFDKVMLKALVGALKQRASLDIFKLKLAVALNRADIAKSELFNGDIEWKNSDLENFMTDALIHNKPKFVRLFIKNGLNIIQYIKSDQLKTLCCAVPTRAQRHFLLLYYVEPQETVTNCAPGPRSPDDPGDSAKTDLCKIFRDHGCDLWFHFFIWAVLQNRQEMATLFWEMTEEPVLSALCGCKVLREMSKEATETETKLSMKENAQMFEDLAHDIFSSCYQTDETRSLNLLIRQSSIWGGTTCLQMGVHANASLFFSHDGVQSYLSKIWLGDMKQNTAVWKLLLTFFCPVLCYTNLISFSEDDEKDAPTSKRRFIKSRWFQFWDAPVTTFLVNVLMYFVFLGLYAYVLLVDFKPPPPAGPSVAEFVLYFWVFTMACEEIRESFFEGSVILQHRLRVYIQDDWNKCDVAAIMLFIIGLTLRMFQWSYGLGRDVLCVDYMVFTLRLIHIFASHEQLGPKIIMVRKMMKDVFFFLFLLGVWIMAYGVANQALLYSYDPNLDRILRRVFYRPYLQIFGENSVEEIDVFAKDGDMTCTDNVTLIDEGAEPCRSFDNNWLVVILLAIYLLVTNILLINLLIAMFNHTFSEVQEKSDSYWKFQRYNLIVEYYNRPNMPPPFIIFSHIYLIKWIIRKRSSNKNHHFVKEFKKKDADQIMMLEKVQKENYIFAQKEKSKTSDSERLTRMSDKVDTVVKQLSEKRDLDLRNRALEKEIKRCLNSLDQIVDTLERSNTFKPPRSPLKSKDFFTHSSNL